MSVTSDAAQLLRREFRTLKRSPLEGVSARPCDSDGLCWDVEIHGLTGSLWQGSVLHARLQFPMTYNCLPPVVEFITIPFHPNVDASTGRVCLRLLDDDHCWGAYAEGGVAMVLLAVQQLLSEPELDDVVNREAASMLLHSRQEYITMATNCVLASQELAAQQSARQNSTEQLPLHALPAPAPEIVQALEKKVRLVHSQEPSEQKNTHAEEAELGNVPAAVAAVKSKAKSVSYIDYLELWRGTATTRPEKGSNLPHADVLKKDPALRQQHLHLSHRQLENAAVERLKYYNTLKYGKISSLATTVESKSVDGRNYHLDRLDYAAELGRTPDEDKERVLQALATQISAQERRRPDDVPARQHASPAAATQRSAATAAATADDGVKEQLRNRGVTAKTAATATMTMMLEPTPFGQPVMLHPNPPVITLPPPTPPASRLAGKTHSEYDDDGATLKAGELPEPLAGSDNGSHGLGSCGDDGEAEAAELVKWSQTLVDDCDM